ncbi:MAG: ATP-dependent DNA helicase RecG [Micrococcales bacterium]|nr:ATP-dependent DNA helicase RecG [Micrococcales bacterium]
MSFEEQAGALWLVRPLKRAVSGGGGKGFATLGLKTVDDLLRHYPRRYDEPGALTPLAVLKPGEHVTVLARVAEARLHRFQSGQGLRIAAVIADHEGGRIDLAFFFKNLPPAEYALKRLVIGREGLFTGIVSEYRGRLQLTHPAYQLFGDEATDDTIDEAILQAGRPIPIYRACQSLASWKIHAAIRTLLDTAPTSLPDPIPQHIRDHEHLMGLAEALRAVHLPEAPESWHRARKRFRFEEAFTLQIALARRRAAAAAQGATPRPPTPDGLLARFDEALPFTLTSAQRRVGDELSEALATPRPMRRLLQGDVGSGKTVVALRAALQCIDAGVQAAILAPTEILATQHLATITTLLGPLAQEGLFAHDDGTPLPAPPSVSVRLLTGSLNAPNRRRVLDDLASGAANLVVGTHALLSDPVEFADLGLVVVDEQHRFGVEQRDVLRTRGTTPPHLLVMTATPIPRTIAMTVFGDLEVSVLDELPAGRPDVTTHLVPADKQTWVDRAWHRVREEINRGGRAFIVCPRIATDTQEAETLLAEETEPPDATPAQQRPLANVEDTARTLAAHPALAGLEIGTLHGRMSSEDKDRTMAALASGSVPIVVATVVIEVGIDVPAATAMVVLDADRFGLAQLHQLRGRIGRGSAPGVCLLVSGAPEDSVAAQRLAALVATRDGFRLAEKDLELRREGDVLGTSQTGTIGALKLLRVTRDADLIVRTRALAETLIAEDPTLSRHRSLSAHLDRMLADREEFLERA